MTQQQQYEAYIRACLEAKPQELLRGVNPVADVLLAQADQLRSCIEAGIMPPVDSLGWTLAKQVHDQWTAEKARQGYTWGPVRNDDSSKGQDKCHPLMKPFEELDFAAVKYDLVTAETTLRTAASIVLSSVK